ncbi:MAG TPA: hypothetical protein VN663_01705 [Ramlibacter sp.]|nr:hypothetical protein [Ramlibacter sp.]
MRIRDPAVVPLPAAADQRFAATVLTADVDHGAALEHDLVGGDMHLAAFEALGSGHAARDVGQIGAFEHHLAALGADARCLDQATVLELAGEDAHGIAFERAEIEGLVAGRLQFQADTLQPAAGQFDLLPGCQQRGAARRLHQRIGADLHVRRDQDHVAAARKDAAIDAERPARRAIAAEHQSTRERVGIAHPQCGCGESGSVHHGTGTDGDARGVDQHQAAVGTERPVDG